MIRTAYDVCESLYEGLTHVSHSAGGLIDFVRRIDTLVGIESDELDDLFKRIERMKKALDLVMLGVDDAPVSSKGRHELEKLYEARAEALKVLQGGSA